MYTDRGQSRKAISYWLLFIPFISSALSIDSASAVQAEHPCEIYARADKNVPDELRSMMEAKQDEAARICSDPRGRVQYDSATRPLHTLDSVCSFQVRGYSETGGSLLRSARFMTQSTVPCPIQSDKRYIAVTGMSEGLFNVLANFARELALSRDTFDSGISNGMTKRSDFESLRAGILEQNPSSRFQLVAMGLTEPSLPGTLGYQLVFQSPISPVRCIMLVDFTSDGLKIFDLGRVL